MVQESKNGKDEILMLQFIIHFVSYQHQPVLCNFCYYWHYSTYIC